MPRTSSTDPDARLALLATERGAISKPHGGRIRVALAFPNTYHVGMSNLGFQTAYRLFNDQAAVVCERVFLPPRQELADRLLSGSRIATLESGLGAHEADVLAFSVSFEWDYTNLLTVLRLAGLPLRAADRDSRHPLVVLGGAVTFVNPEPLAPFVDVIAVGEGEALVPVLTSEMAAASSRRDLLGRLAAREGFYVPSLYEPVYDEEGRLSSFGPDERAGARVPVQKATVKLPTADDPPHTVIFTPGTEFGSRFLVEVVRGCPNLCRFCWAGYNYLPVRPFDADRILALARRARPYANRAGLVSIALCDHPDIDRILGGLAEMGYSISPASLRLDDLTPAIVDRLHQTGERTLTIAPETGSDRLRRVVNKTVTNEQILDRAELVFSSGIENLKLYFMIGLPTETDEDLVAIRDLTAELRQIMVKHARRRGRIGRIIGSVNPLVPKPGTAYQWLPMERSSEIERRIRRLRRLTAGMGSVYFNIKSERHSFYQALLSLGDRRVAPVIEAAEANGGHWRQAAAAAGVDPADYVFRDRRHDPLLPWEIVSSSPRPAFLRNELDKAMRAEFTLPQKRRQAPPEVTHAS